MAVPKKKVSRSRRNMRRYSSNKRLVPVATTKDLLSGEFVRTHTISMKKGEVFDTAKLIAARTAARAAAKAKAKKAPKAQTANK